MRTQRLLFLGTCGFGSACEGMRHLTFNVTDLDSFASPITAGVLMTTISAPSQIWGATVNDPKMKGK